MLPCAQISEDDVGSDWEARHLESCSDYLGHWTNFTFTGLVFKNETLTHVPYHTCTTLFNFLLCNFFFCKVLSTIFVSISIVGMTISTLPSLQYKDARGNTIDNPSLAMVETVCIAWFTLEYFIRLAGAPQKWAFLKDGMNVVDVLAIMPFFVSLFFGSGSEFGESNEESSEFNSIPSSGELDDSQKGGMDEILQVVLLMSRHV